LSRHIQKKGNPLGQDLIINKEWAGRGNQWVRIGLPVLILIVYGWISRLPDLRVNVPEWIGASAVIVMLLGLACLLEIQGKNDGWSAAFIIFLGVVFRMMFLVRPPELSDDIFRYVFDGQMLLASQNPYSAAPLDAVLSHPLLSDLAAQVNHGELPTIYPPAAQFVFAAGAFLGGVFGMKLTLICLDIFTCVLMARILKMLRLPASGLILYAWHPLPVMEIAGSGHIDAAGIFFLFLSLFFLMKNKFRPVSTGFPWPVLSGWGAGFFFAAAVLTKWLPLMFLPGIFLLAGSRGRKAAAFGFFAGGLVMAAWFWPDLCNGFYTLSIYVANWEFSGFAFRMLRAFLGSGTMARLILAAAFLSWAGVLYFRYYRAIRGLEEQKTAGDGLLVFRSFYDVTMTFLLFTPTLHPWYALYLAAFLPFVGGSAGIIFSWSVFLGYRVLILYALIGLWVESDLMSMLIILGPAAAYAGVLFFGVAVRHKPLQTI